jgi:beta-fructofuranosidase
MLRIEDRWVWDLWIARTSSQYHMFFLQAPRSLGDQVQRHFNATVGHAVSQDLRAWTVLGDALAPGRPGSWDDMATWTGSVLEHEGTWHLFYTGTTRTADGAHQRIGLATSTDLSRWTKHPGNPLIEGDPRWYEQVEFDAWRDPWVFRDPTGEGFRALVTARATRGPADARGIIGHAWSPDLLRWEVRPPLPEPGALAHPPVPQVEVVGGTPVLLFSASSLRIGAERRARLPGEPTGSFLAIGESLLGPWDIANARPIPVPDLYSARIVRDRAGAWQVLGFYDASERGAFVGQISDPIPLWSLGLL